MFRTQRTTNPFTGVRSGPHHGAQLFTHFCTPYTKCSCGVERTEDPKALEVRTACERSPGANASICLVVTFGSTGACD